MSPGQESSPVSTATQCLGPSVSEREGESVAPWAEGLNVSWRPSQTSLLKSKRNAWLESDTLEVRRLLIKTNSSDSGLIFLRLS